MAIWLLFEQVLTALCLDKDTLINVDIDNFLFKLSYPNPVCYIIKLLCVIKCSKPNNWPLLDLLSKYQPLKNTYWVTTVLPVYLMCRLVEELFMWFDPTDLSIVVCLSVFIESILQPKESQRTKTEQNYRDM